MALSSAEGRPSYLHSSGFTSSSLGTSTPRDTADKTGGKRPFRGDYLSNHFLRFPSVMKIEGGKQEVVDWLQHVRNWLPFLHICIIFPSPSGQKQSRRQNSRKERAEQSDQEHWLQDPLVMGPLALTVHVTWRKPLNYFQFPPWYTGTLKGIMNAPLLKGCCEN